MHIVLKLVKINFAIDKIEIGRDNDLANTAESFKKCTIELIDDIVNNWGGNSRLSHFIADKAKEIDKNTININV